MYNYILVGRRVIVRLWHWSTFGPLRYPSVLFLQILQLTIQCSPVWNQITDGRRCRSCFHSPNATHQDLQWVWDIISFQYYFNSKKQLANENNREFIPMAIHCVNVLRSCHYDDNDNQRVFAHWTSPLLSTPLRYTTYPSHLPPRLYSQVVIEYYRLRPTSQIAIRYVGAGKFMTSVHVPLQSQLAILLWSRSISYCSSYSTVHTSNYPSCL